MPIYVTKIFLAITVGVGHSKFEMGRLDMNDVIELGVLDFVIKVYRPCDRFPQGGKMSQVRRTNQSALSTRR